MRVLAAAGVLFRTMIILILALRLSLVAAAPATVADATPLPSPTAVSTHVEPDFPSGLTFRANIPRPADTPIDGASLFYRIGADDTLNLATVLAGNVVVDHHAVQVEVFVDLRSAWLPVGVTLEFFWELTRAGTVVISTTEESTLWSDTRFDWETQASEQITLHSYDMSPDFAAWMLDQSQMTLDDLENRYDLDTIAPVTIWVYPNSQDFAGTRQVNTREAVAGISYPGASVIVAVVRDGDTREYGRVIPHEISHQALFHATENPYAFPPLWLDEGLATHYQTGGTDHYAGMVWRAERDGTLFDITSLNVSFPFQPAQATLAYASSWSVVTYIEAVYGPEGISRLIDAFSQGFPVDDAIDQALGVSSADLNTGWHQWISDQDKPEN